jgi:cytochrome c peroxidase
VNTEAGSQSHARARHSHAAIRAIDPEQPVVDTQTMVQVLDETLTQQHFSALLLAIFAGVALRYHPRARFFWDERGGNLEAMVLLPIENRLEMGMDLAKLPGILAAEPRYATLFRQAFGDPEITNEGIARVLAQFLRSMVSYQSRYDEGRRQTRSSQDDFPNYTLEENRGKALFLRNCAACHLPAGASFHGALEVGDAGEALQDRPGRALLDGRSAGEHRARRGYGCHRPPRRRHHAQAAGRRALQVALSAQRRSDRPVHARRPVPDARRRH